jgi:phosphate transport system permease protein
MLLGTLLTTLGSIILAAPLGILSAVFCQFYAPPILAVIYRGLIQLLAGIPSVVYGFWGLVVLVPLINKLHPPGASLLAGILILSAVVLPTITLIADASLSKVPQSYLQGAAALGLSRWGTIAKIVFPAAKSGLIASLILATARAIGETMAVMMVCGNVVAIPNSIFAPIRTLTANIALEMAYAAGDHRRALFASGLLLMLIILVLVAIAATFLEAE